MDDILNDFSNEFEGRRYIDPSVATTETNAFIDRFRETQRGNTQEISNQTEMLGTDVPSSLGGLTGAGSYFTGRYQIPQTNAVLQNLRTAALLAAANQAGKNELAMWQKRQQDAYNAYQRRQNRRGSGGGGSGGTGGGGIAPEGETEYTPTDYIVEGVTPGVSGGYTTALIDTETGEILGYTGVPYGQEGQTNYIYDKSGKVTSTTQPKTLFDPNSSAAVAGQLGSNFRR